MNPFSTQKAAAKKPNPVKTLAPSIAKPPKSSRDNTDDVTDVTMEAANEEPVEEEPIKKPEKKGSSMKTALDCIQFDEIEEEKEGMCVVYM